VSIATIIELAEAEARGQDYVEIQPTHLLLGLLAAEGDPALSSVRNDFARVRSAPRLRASGRIPLSPGSRALVAQSSDGVSLRRALMSRGPLQVVSALSALEAAA
jgi:hypothetical protein